ncbi:MAG: hypothetical protein SNJ84_01670 [Verrucomicrobiia bacterium]
MTGKKSCLRLRNFQDILKFMIGEFRAARPQILVVFDTTDDRLRRLARTIARSAPPGTYRFLSLWDLQRLDDLPAFDRREVLGRARVHLPHGPTLDGTEAIAWMRSQAAAPTQELVAA